jgi:hypothetical protein
MAHAGTGNSFGQRFEIDDISGVYETSNGDWE